MTKAHDGRATRDNVLALRLTEKEWKEVVKAAQASGLHAFPAQWARAKVLEAARQIGS